MHKRFLTGFTGLMVIFCFATGCKKNQTDNKKVTVAESSSKKATAETAEENKGAAGEVNCANFVDKVAGVLAKEYNAQKDEFSHSMLKQCTEAELAKVSEGAKCLMAATKAADFSKCDEKAAKLVDKWFK